MSQSMQLIANDMRMACLVDEFCTKIFSKHSSVACILANTICNVVLQYAIVYAM